MKAQEGQSSTPATYMLITLRGFFLSVELNEIFVEELNKKYSVKTVHFSYLYIALIQSRFSQYRSFVVLLASEMNFVGGTAILR